MTITQPMALADDHDAPVFAHACKPPMSRERTVGIIAEGRGSHFDPDVVDAPFAVQPEFVRITASFRDDRVDAAIVTEPGGRQ